MSKTIGIIGTGAIAEAVVIGLCNKTNPPKKIVLSYQPPLRIKSEQLNFLSTTCVTSPLWLAVTPRSLS